METNGYHNEMSTHPTDAASRVDSYLICGTPRTGSSLLCGLLESTGVAGHPESYFRAPDVQAWATHWGIAPSPEAPFRYADYVHAAVTAGRTENGVFAARMMWGTLDEVVEALGAVYPDLAGADRDLLDRAFGATRYVYLRRDDVIAQAVSWVLAEQSGVWVETDESRRARPQELHFDFDHIHDVVQMIDEHNAAWQAWFASFGVRPHLVRYEDLDADPVAVTRGVLHFLELEIPSEREISAKHQRLGDDVNAQWITRYRAEIAQVETSARAPMQSAR